MLAESVLVLLLAFVQASAVGAWRTGQHRRQQFFRYGSCLYIKLLACLSMIKPAALQHICGILLCAIGHVHSAAFVAIEMTFILLTPMHCCRSLSVCVTHQPLCGAEYSGTFSSGACQLKAVNRLPCSVSSSWSVLIRRQLPAGLSDTEVMNWRHDWAAIKRSLEVQQTVTLQSSATPEAGRQMET